MATVYDVAQAIVERLPEAGRDSMRLQKLVYFAQSWSLAWDARPLFGEQIEAWKDGPVVRDLYRAMKYEGGFKSKADTSRLDDAAIATVNAVVNAYGVKPATWLSELTHRETPWLTARGGLPPSAPSKEPMTHDSIRAHYSSFASQSRDKTISPALMRGLEILVETPEDEVPLLLKGTTDSIGGDTYLRWLENGDECPE